MPGMVAVDVALSLEELGQGTTHEIAEHAGCSPDSARYALDWMAYRGFATVEGNKTRRWSRPSNGVGILDDEHMRVLSEMFDDLAPHEWAKRWGATTEQILAARQWVTSCSGVEW